MWAKWTANHRLSSVHVRRGVKPASFNMRRALEIVYLWLKGRVREKR